MSNNAINYAYALIHVQTDDIQLVSQETDYTFKHDYIASTEIAGVNEEESTIMVRLSFTFPLDEQDQLDVEWNTDYSFMMNGEELHTEWLEMTDNCPGWV